MSKEDTIQRDGKVIKLLPNAMFKVILEENGAEVDARLCGKMRVMGIRISVGDRVKLDISTYDLSKARIIYRYNPLPLRPPSPSS